MPRHLVVVESPTKAKTIKRFLGNDYHVEASMGHVRDLPTKTLGVDTNKDFAPVYEVPQEKEAVVRRLKSALKDADDLWIATDEDREGEAIGWHLIEALSVPKKKSIHRIVFHEITEKAILESVLHPRAIDMRLVDAQQARRMLDRLVGYTLSPFLWRKVYSGLSAGRVQSVAVRILVDRERAVQAFVPEEYWTVDVLLKTIRGDQVRAGLKKRDGRDFVPSSEVEVQEVIKELADATYTVIALDEKEVSRNPTPPFTTSTLQQEAGRKLHFSVKQTMVIAQQLYEGVDLGKGQGMQGLITYMRTDSVHLSDKALQDAQVVIEKKFGREYVLASPRQYRTKSKGAQEAHEAIRPTELDRTPESLADILDHQQLKLYTLIWNRMMATQMPSAQFKRVSADIIAAGTGSKTKYTFRATGQTVLFDGFMRVYFESNDEESDEKEDGEKILPVLLKNEELIGQELIPGQHFTKPPARYTEASLVKKLEEEGIGRPSTYAPTISTIQQRGYVRKEGRNLIPETVAFAVTDLLTAHFPDIVNLTFTATMEESLDEIAEGKKDTVKFLKGFYGPFQKLVAEKTQEVKREDVLQDRVLGSDPVSGKEVRVRIGRFGPYVQLGAVEAGASKKDMRSVRTAALPKGVKPEDIHLEDAVKLLAFPRALGLWDGEEVQVAIGRFGPYIRWGKVTVSIPQDIDPMSLEMEKAKEMIVAAKEDRKRMQQPLKSLGKDPTTGGEILVKDGRFGPYVTDGKTNASLGKKFDPLSITFEQAVELLVKKRARPPRKWGKKK